MNEGCHHAENLQRFRIRVQGREVRVHRLQGWPRRQKQAFYRKFTLNFRDNNIPVPRLFCFIHDQQIAGLEPNISH